MFEDLSDSPFIEDEGMIVQHSRNPFSCYRKAPYLRYRSNIRTLLKMCKQIV